MHCHPNMMVPAPGARSNQVRVSGWKAHTRTRLCTAHDVAHSWFRDRTRNGFEESRASVEKSDARSFYKVACGAQWYRLPRLRHGARWARPTLRHGDLGWAGHRSRNEPGRGAEHRHTWRRYSRRDRP